MNVKKIVVNKEELICKDLYPYQYDFGKGKEVLRIQIEEANGTFEDIKRILSNCEYPIDYYVNDELKISYENYSNDFNCTYGNGVYSIEITRTSELERRVLSLETQYNELLSKMNG